MIGPSIQRILVPVDFSACSGDAFRLAGSLADALGASIEVLHVIDVGARRLGSAEPPERNDSATARESLRQFLAAAGGGGPVPSGRVETGEPREVIVSLAKDEGFDLIVMGTHGRTGRSHTFVGSVAESVVRTSPRPVLTVREGAFEGEGRVQPSAPDVS